MTFLPSLLLSGSTAFDLPLVEGCAPSLRFYGVYVLLRLIDFAICNSTNCHLAIANFHFSINFVSSTLDESNFPSSPSSAGFGTN